MKRMSFLQKKSMSLAYKLGIVIFLVSTMVTLVTTGIQLYFEYRSGIQELDQNFRQIENSNMPAISHALWQLDTDQLKIQAQGILNLRDIQAVRIFTKDKMLVEVERQNLKSGPAEAWKKELIYKNEFGQAEDIGMLEVRGSYEAIRARTLRLFWWILFTQTVRTFAVSIFIFFIANYLIIGRLQMLGTYLGDYNLVSSREHVNFPNQKILGSDEINAVIDSTNRLLQRLSSAYRQTAEEYRGRMQSEAQKKMAISQLEEIGRLNASLEAQKNELVFLNDELEAFAYSVAHDLRSPLRSLNGFSHILVEDFSENLPDEAKGYLSRISNAALKMGSLIDDILSLAKVARDRVEKEVCSISEMVQEAMDRTALTYPELKYIYSAQKNLNVEADPRLLRIAIENLVNNAFKYSSKVDQPRIEFRFDEKQKCFCLEDNGDGFDSTQESRLFKPFFRLHSTAEFPGTGIGLATVARVIAKHGGKVWAESQKGKGSTFKFTV